MLGKWGGEECWVRGGEDCWVRGRREMLGK